MTMSGNPSGHPTPEAPPPSYNSLMVRVKDAKASSTSHVVFARRFVGIIFGTLAVTILLSVFLSIPITMVVIGSVYLHDCPAERYIPIYLIVAGASGTVQVLIMLIYRIINRKSKDDEEGGSAMAIFVVGTILLLSCFIFAWFIAGNVWVYSLYGHFTTDDPTSPDYCNHTCYYFTFWVTTAAYITGCVSSCCGCLKQE